MSSAMLYKMLYLELNVVNKIKSMAVLIETLYTRWEESHNVYAHNELHRKRPFGALLENLFLPIT